MDELNEMIQALPWVLSVALLILSVVLAINWLCTKFELDEMNELNRRLFLDHLHKKNEADIRYDAKFKKLHDFEQLAYTYMCNDANELKLLIEDMVKRIGEQEKLAKQNWDYHKSEVDDKIKRLKRALYKACANWACTKMEYEQFGSNVFMLGVATEKEVSWESMMKKCQAKMEEYR